MAQGLLASMTLPYAVYQQAGTVVIPGWVSLLKHVRDEVTAN
jgi:hypothetical protein